MSINFNNPIVGFPEEWDSFFKRHPSWPKVLDNLHQILEKTFIRKAKVNTPSERIVFFMGRLCAEDFNEICLLVANGYGFGSLKILRGFYERVVTIIYISENENEAQQFLEYHYIHKGKLLTHAETFFGKLEQYLDKEEIAETKNNFNKYKVQFQQTSCKKCKTKRIMHSWSKLDIAAMAKRTKLDHLYFPGYYYPTLQSHATISSMIYRLKSAETESVSFNEMSQPEMADNSLIIAHNLLIRMVNNQNEFFKLKLSTDLELLIKDFKRMWNRHIEDKV